MFLTIPHQLFLLIVAFCLWNVLLNLVFIRHAVDEGRISEAAVRAAQVKVGNYIALSAASIVVFAFNTGVTMTEIIGFAATNATALVIVIGAIHAGIFMTLTAHAGHLLFKKPTVTRAQRIYPTL